jgi:hypothetical protein
VLDAAGVRVFLSSEAAGLLDDKDLDAAVDADGTVRFALTHRLAYLMDSRVYRTV